MDNLRGLRNDRQIGSQSRQSSSISRADSLLLISPMEYMVRGETLLKNTNLKKNVIYQMKKLEHGRNHWVHSEVILRNPTIFRMQRPILFNVSGVCDLRDMQYNLNRP